jgi:peptide/nickel transport system permease protein
LGALALRRGRELYISAFLFLALFLMAVVFPLFWKSDPLKTDLYNRLLPPGRGYPMGTDGSGRDMLARFMYGARISLFSGILVVIGSAITGMSLGILAARFQGPVDTIIMRLLDILLAFPQLILAMAVTICLGPNLTSACIGISLGCIPVYARLMRSEALQIQKKLFVRTARLLGFHSFYIFFRHIIPFSAPTMLVQSAAVFGSAIISLSALGFVGLGAQIPVPEWGAMIADGMKFILSGGWWIVLWPGIGLFITVAAANLLADALNFRLTEDGRTI